MSLGLFATAGGAAVISAGTPTTTVPAALDDPFATLTSPLTGGQFLLPIQITGANGLQDWSFDLTFNGSAVQPLNAFGLTQHVYAAHFNAVDTTLSSITSSGTPLGTPTNTLDDIAGFSSGVTGDGLLAFILFETVGTGTPDFGIGDSNITQKAPAPGTLLLLISALAALGLRRRPQDRNLT